MIKKCNVILHNTAALVVDYEGKMIQLPYVKDVCDIVYVKLESGKYLISSEKEYEDSLKSKDTKRGKKVNLNKNTLIKEHVESEAVENETDEMSE